MPKKIINKKKSVQKKKSSVRSKSKVDFSQKCMDLIHQIQSLLKKSSVKKGKGKKMVGGDNFIKDIQRAGKGLSLAMIHTFDSMSNLGKDMYCETDAIMNIGRELDMGYTKDCPFTKTKSWDWEQIKQ
jgi:hypothetical protein